MFGFTLQVTTLEISTVIQTGDHLLMAGKCTKINEINYLQLKSNVIAVFGVIGLFRFMYIIFMMRLLSKNSIIQLKLAFPNLKKDSHCIHFSYIDKTCLHPVLK